MNLHLPTPDVAGPGEPAWRCERIPEVARELARQGHAVLGGELWAFIDGEVWGVLPQQEGGPGGVWGWGCSRVPSERWADFCARAAQEAIDIVSNADFDWVHEAFRPHVVVNLTWCDELWYDGTVATSDSYRQ